MGIALFEGEKLIYHAVEDVSGSSSQETLVRGRALIQRLLQDFKPRTLAIEKPYFSNNKASLLSSLTLQMKKIAKREGVRVTEVAASTVKKSVAGTGDASKEEVCKAVIARFPQLKAYRTRERKWKQRYHQNRFDAVAVGITSAYNSEGRSNSLTTKS